MKKTLVREIASLLQAYQTCVERGNGEWRTKHEANITYLVKNFMPSGSGIDCGTKLDWETSNPNKLVFDMSYHHMNDAGYYDGWTEHKVIVTPSLQFGFDLKITGRNRNDVKEYLTETYHLALEEEIDHDGEVYFSTYYRAKQAEFKAKVANGEIT